MKQFDLRIWVTFLIVMWGVGYAGAAVEEMVYENEDHLNSLTTSATLVIVGRINSIEYGCINEREAYADVDVDVEETWRGQCPPKLDLRIRGVKESGLDCEHFVDGNAPDLAIGKSLLFICWPRFDNKTEEWLDGYRVPLAGVLEINESRDEIQFFGSERRINIPQSGLVLKEVLKRRSPEGLFRRADLVLVIQSPSVPGKSGELKNFGAIGPVSASVTKVLKGECIQPTIQFDTRLYSDLLFPRICSDDVSLVFLKRDKDGNLGLLDGPDGYLLVKKGEIFYRSNNSSGRVFDSRGAIQKGKR